MSVVIEHANRFNAVACVQFADLARMYSNLTEKRDSCYLLRSDTRVDSKAILISVTEGSHLISAIMISVARAGMIAWTTSVGTDADSRRYFQDRFDARIATTDDTAALDCARQVRAFFSTLPEKFSANILLTVSIIAQSS